MKLLLILLFGSFTPFSLFAQHGKNIAVKVSPGQALYAKHCMTCHQIDGAGAQNMIPPLKQSTQVLGDKAQLIKIVLNGLNGEIKVNGDIYAGEMPAHKDLTDVGIGQILSYVRSSFGNSAGLVRSSEVKKVRLSTNK